MNSNGASPLPRVWLFLLAVAMATTCSCGRALRQYDERTNEQSDLAPLVVVGLAEHDQRVGGPTPSLRDPKYPMQLHRVTVHIENVLKGIAPQRTIPVYYFAYAGGYDGPHPLIFGSEVSRRILWLRKDDGRYRIACDGWNCTKPIMSGAHPGFRMSQSEPIQRAMADLLLTKGEGPIDDHQFALEIDQGVPDRGFEGYVIEKLRQLELATTESSEVKYAACRGLWGYSRSRLDDHLRERAADSLRVAGCVCGIERRFDLVCRVK